MDQDRHVDVGALYAALEAKREAEGRPWRAIADEVGVSPSTFTRLGQGHGTDINTFAKLAAWLNIPMDAFVAGDKPDESASEETLTAISAFLRADRNLKPRSAQAIETVLRAAYAQLSEQPDVTAR